ncbi:MAG: hypothetical protein P8J45_03030 [Phycisphaerales bacterium]|nr:hypothetical protein [Phycisphaerales bacterium]
MSDEGTPPGDQEHPDRIRTLFGKAIDLPESERTAFIEAQSPDDPDLAVEYPALLEELSPSDE